jgi:cytidine deaminase
MSRISATANAVAAAVAAGDTRFQQLVLIADTDQPISPCGACRQVLAEFAPDLSITSVTVRGVRESMSLVSLLPRPKTGILNYSQE